MPPQLGILALGIIPSTAVMSTTYANIYLHLYRNLIYLTKIQMPNARQRILSYITEKKSATVEELSMVFKVTPANIRHHLSILIEQGSVNIIGLKPAALKGRPSQIYSAAQQINQNNLDQLIEVLLSYAEKNMGYNHKDHLLKDIACGLVAKFPPDTNNPTRRLYSSIRALNRMNYQAHWEAHGEHPRIMLGHCPYSVLVDRHPEICRMDEFMLQALLDSPVEQIEKLTGTAKGLSQCVFFMHRPAGTN
jgi:predicted ArsR family transcriptional regulator